MLRFDKAIYVSFLLKHILFVRVTVYEDQMFYYFQNSFIYCIHFGIIPVLNFLYSLNFFCLIQRIYCLPYIKNMLFSFSKFSDYYLLLLVLELLVIFEAFA